MAFDGPESTDYRNVTSLNRAYLSLLQRDLRSRQGLRLLPAPLSQKITGLSKRQIERLAATPFLLLYGIVKLPGLISATLLDELRACFEWSIAHPGPIATGRTDREDISFVDNGNPDARSMYHDLILRSGFGKIVALLWSSQYVGYFAEEIFWKKGKANPTFWHQDTAYQPWSGEHWCNMWIPLASMSADQSIQVVRGSHNGIQYDGTTFNPNNPTQSLWGEQGDFPRLPDISAELAANPDSWDIVGFDVVPGDVVILHPHGLHRGGGTDATLPERRNIVFRFFGDKSYYSDHLPKTKGMYDLKPIPSATGGYLADGDLYRPANSITAN